MSLGNFGRDMLAEAARIAEQTVARYGTHLRWATITEVDPLRIRYDGEPNPSIVTPQNTEARLAVGDRVQIVKQKGQAVIIGRAGGSRVLADQIEGVFDKDQLPYRVASGLFQATVDTVNTPKLHTITYPSGLFTSAPQVFINYYLTIPDYASISLNALGVTSFSFYIMRKNTNPTNLIWRAFEDL